MKIIQTGTVSFQHDACLLIAHITFAPDTTLWKLELCEPQGLVDGYLTFWIDDSGVVHYHTLRIALVVKFQDALLFSTVPRPYLNLNLTAIRAILSPTISAHMLASCLRIYPPPKGTSLYNTR